MIGENGDAVVMVFEDEHYATLTVRVPETESVAAIRLTASQASMVAAALEKVPEDLGDDD